jgi:hypothetical protein
MEVAGVRNPPCFARNGDGRHAQPAMLCTKRRAGLQKNPCRTPAAAFGLRPGDLAASFPWTNLLSVTAITACERMSTAESASEARTALEWLTMNA